MRETQIDFGGGEENPYPGHIQWAYSFYAMACFVSATRTTGLRCIITDSGWHKNGLALRIVEARGKIVSLEISVTFLEFLTRCNLAHLRCTLLENPENPRRRDFPEPRRCICTRISYKERDI